MLAMSHSPSKSANASWRPASNVASTAEEASGASKTRAPPAPAQRTSVPDSTGAYRRTRAASM